jgi:hypothetical protein
MTVIELIKLLIAMPLDHDVIISSQGETVQVPIECALEFSHEDDKPFVRLTTDNRERD